MDDKARLRLGADLVQQYLQGCPKGRGRRCLQELGLSIREEIPHRKRDFVMHAGLWVLKLLVLGSFIALAIVGWLVLPDEKEDESDSERSTRENLEKVRKWSEVGLMCGLGFYFVFFFWPDTQGREGSRMNFIRRSKYKSINVPNNVERLSMFIAGILLLIFGFRLVFKDDDCD